MRMNVNLLFLGLSVAYLIGAELYRWKRGALPFGRMGTMAWVSAAVWIVLWLTSFRQD